MNWRFYQTSGDSANAIVPGFKILSWCDLFLGEGGISIGLERVGFRKPYQHLPVGVPIN